MVDTVRTLAALQALLADNTAGDISPQDHRDELVSSWTPEWVRYLGHRLPDETAHALDDFFDSDTSADYTQTTPTGTATPTIGRGVLSWVFDDQSTSDMVGYTKAFGAISPPITIETAVRLYGSNGTKFAGLLFSDGTAATSNYFGVFTGPVSTTSGQFTAYSGTFTAATTDHGPYNLTGWSNAFGLVYLREIWKTTNTFKMQMSIDGVTWTDFGEGDMTFTMTPTRIGLLVSNYANTSPSLASHEYLRVNEVDASA
jgi:hypothetical protein